MDVQENLFLVFAVGTGLKCPISMSTWTIPKVRCRWVARLGPEGVHRSTDQGKSRQAASGTKERKGYISSITQYFLKIRMVV